MRGLAGFFVRTASFGDKTNGSALTYLRYSAGPPTSVGAKDLALAVFASQRGTPSTHTAVWPSLRLTNPFSTDDGGSAVRPSSPGTSPRLRASSMRWRSCGVKKSFPSNGLARSGLAVAGALGRDWGGAMARGGGGGGDSKTGAIRATAASGSASTTQTHARRGHEGVKVASRFGRRQQRGDLRVFHLWPAA